MDHPDRTSLRKAASPIDKYSLFGACAQRDTTHGFPGLIAFYQRTNDSNIGPGKASQHLVQAATSWSYGLEVQQPLLRGNVMLGIRPVKYIGGLQPSKSGYAFLRTAKPHYGVFDISTRDPRLSPYLWAQFEGAVGGAV